MTVKKAHNVAVQVEKKLKNANHKISEVIIYEESIADLIYSEGTATGTHIRSLYRTLSKTIPRDYSNSQIQTIKDRRR